MKKFRTQVYLPEEMAQEIDLLARRRGKPKAQVIRRLITRGLALVRAEQQNAHDLDPTDNDGADIRR